MGPDFPAISFQSLITGQGTSGPEGIRTPDLLSAIEARSQLRYRPAYKANGILTEADVYVKRLGCGRVQPGLGRKV